MAKYFYAFFFLLISISFSLVIPYFHKLSPFFHSYIDPIGQALCYSPAITALLFLAVKKDFHRGAFSFKKFKASILPQAILIPLGLLIIVTFLQLIFNVVAFKPADSMPLLNSTLQTLVKLIFIILLSIFYSGIGEELGWRGFLFNKLKGLPWLQIVLLLNFVWALWHIPLFLSGTYPNASIIKFLIFALTTIELGTILIYLRLKSGSVIPCIIFHGCINGFGFLPMINLDIKNQFWGAFPNLFFTIALLAPAIYFYKKGAELYKNELANMTS